MEGMASLARLDGMAQADLCTRGEISPSELIDACMARIASRHLRSNSSLPSLTMAMGRLEGGRRHPPS